MYKSYGHSFPGAVIKQKDELTENLLRREKRWLSTVVSTLSTVIHVGGTVDKAVSDAKNERSVFECELENFSKWPLVQPSVNLNASDLVEQHPLVILPGFEEAFVAKRSSILTRNEGTVEWQLEQMWSTVQVDWSVQNQLWCTLVWWAHPPICTNRLNVCINDECEYQEYGGEESGSNCVCSGDLCVTASMGTTDQATAKIYVLPKSRTNFAPEMAQRLEDNYYNYC